MRVLPTAELSDLIALFVTLLIFFSLDSKFRFSKNSNARHAKLFFEIVTIVGGIFTVLSALITWIAFFLPEKYFVQWYLILIPGTIAFLAALTLCVEVLFLRSNPELKNLHPHLKEHNRLNEQSGGQSDRQVDGQSDQQVDQREGGQR